MPVYKSTTETFIMGHSNNHARIIEEATSRDQLLHLSSSCHLYDGQYSSLSRLTTEGARPSSRVQQDCRQIPEQATFSLRHPRDVPSGARHAFKNLIVLGSSFMLVFTAFISLQSLQSSLNNDVGLTSLSCLYGATVFSCFFAPAVIGQLTTKWTISLGQFVFLAYFLSNLLPRAYMVVPSSLLLGLFTGPMWSAQATYLTTLAIRYAQISSELHDLAVNKFNGVFCALLQTSQIWGNFLSAGVLSAEANGTRSLNHSQIQTSCGAQDCAPRDYFPEGTPPHQLDHVPPFTRHLLIGVHAACALTAIAMTTICLDRNEMNALWDKGSISASSQQLFLSTIRMLKDARLQALSPLVLFTGVEQGFIMGDFTKSYVNCALGIHKIGFVMVCFGTVNALTSISIGHIARHVKRYPIVVAGTLFNACLLMALLWWLPSSEDMPMFYVISGCLGLCDAIWQTQTNTLFGLLFADNQEAAFANYRMFQATGFALAFGYSQFLCVRTKVFIMAGLLLVALVFYSAVEFKMQQNKKLRQGIVIL